MDIVAIPMLINSDFMEIPLDKRLDLADYKLYGEKSHVFQNKDRLHSLYETTGLTMNDLTINGETLEYFIKKNKTGIALASVYGIENVQTLVTLTAMQAVINSSTAMQAVANSSAAMQAVLNSSTAMQAVIKVGKKVYYGDRGNASQLDTKGYTLLSSFEAINSQNGQVFILTGRMDDNDSRYMTIVDVLNRAYNVFGTGTVAGDSQWDYFDKGLYAFKLPIQVMNRGGSAHGICGVIA